ncbi:MAG: carbohydrate kinase family protein [Clostridia bacterium]|nr:carbohydrate kinase family protein [Clostridia bacterium]
MDQCTRWDIYTMGDLNVDLIVPGVTRLPPPGTEQMIDGMETHVGGGAALFSMGCATLGMQVAFQGIVGNDLYGTYLLGKMEKAGVDLSCLRRTDERNTGISISFTDEKDRCFVTDWGTNHLVSIRELQMDQAKKARHLHLTGYHGKDHDAWLDVLTRAHGAGLSVSLDTGWDPEERWSDGLFELLPMTDILLMNETECLHYTGAKTAEDGAAILSGVAGMAVIKLGKRGAMVCKKGQILHAPGFPMRAVDTTGAGDSFNAGFVSYYLGGHPLQECLRAGNACGGLSVTRRGGHAGFPDRVLLETFLSSHR